MQAPDSQPFAALDSAVDQAWEWMRDSFDGDWLGTTTWYERDSHGVNLERGITNATPSLYAIRFADAHSGEWHGTGLRYAPGGERRFPLHRHTYNLGYNCWHFLQTAGQSSLRMDADLAKAGHEVNFFHGRSRSMLVVLYQPWADGHLRLESIAATSFRCERSEPEPSRPGFTSLEALLVVPAGWPGMESTLNPGVHSEQTAPGRPCPGFTADTFLQHGVSGVFEDQLVCSLPDQLPVGSFELHVGCLVEPETFVHCLIGFDADHHLVGWRERRYHPTKQR
jgi:hypothetical protein